MSGKPAHLNDILNAVDPRPLADEPEAVMESLGPCAWCFPKPVFALDVERGAEPVVAFQYVFLGIRATWTPESFVFEFKDGEERWRLTVKGRNLRPVFDRISEHRIRRIRRADRDFEDGKQPVITGISVEEVVEAPE
jgi:hypothetical protein